MRKLMIATLMMIGLSSFAQQNVQKGRDLLSAEQRTELQVKKLTLELDLNETQQKQLYTVIQKQQKAHDAAKANRGEAKKNAAKPTADERFAMRKASLDRKIAFKQEVKNILTPVQFEKWEQNSGQRKAHGKKRGELKHADKRKDISK
ncbi:MAG TPA: hypothetical protein VGB44_02350 [Flavobacterium sp.]|jgi:hypothetical protein